jgi:hypothetical protein
VIAVGYSTLYKYFKDELDLGHIKANSLVAETAFKMATSGKCPSATFFYLTAQFVVRLERLGPGFALGRGQALYSVRLHWFRGHFLDLAGLEGWLGLHNRRARSRLTRLNRWTTLQQTDA